jgi:hypothetical protein
MLNFIERNLKGLSPYKEARSLIEEELKNRVGGGDEIKKINRPISLGKEGFPKREVLKD